MIDNNRWKSLVGTDYKNIDLFADNRTSDGVVPVAIYTRKNGKHVYVEVQLATSGYSEVVSSSRSDIERAARHRGNASRLGLQ